MTLKRTVIICDESIIKEFKELCKKNGRVVSKVVEGWMVTYCETAKLSELRKKNGKKNKST